MRNRTRSISLLLWAAILMASTLPTADAQRPSYTTRANPLTGVCTITTSTSPFDDEVMTLGSVSQTESETASDNKSLKTTTPSQVATITTDFPQDAEQSKSRTNRHHRKPSRTINTARLRPGATDHPPTCSIAQRATITDKLDGGVKDISAVARPPATTANLRQRQTHFLRIPTHPADRAHPHARDLPVFPVII